MDKNDLKFLKYRIHGIDYLKFFKALKRLRIDFLQNHRSEFNFLYKFKEYGIHYLKFLKDAIDLNLREIVDVKDLMELNQRPILYWVFLNYVKERRDENN